MASAIGLPSLSTIIVALALLDFLALVIYVPVVLQNITFTFDELSISDIPFYSASLGSSTTTRYDYNWWEFASDGLRVFPPVMCLICIIFQIILRPHRTLGYIIVNSILLVIEILKAIKRAVNWAECSNYQFCRNFNPSESSSSINYVFLTCNIMGYVFLLFAVVFLAFLPVIEISARHYSKARTTEEQVIQDNISALLAQQDVKMLTFPAKKKKSRRT